MTDFVGLSRRSPHRFTLRVSGCGSLPAHIRILAVFHTAPCSYMLASFKHAVFCACFACPKTARLTTALYSKIIIEHYAPRTVHQNMNEIKHAARVLSRYRDARRTRILRIRLRLTVRVKKAAALRQPLTTLQSLSQLKCQMSLYCISSSKTQTGSSHAKRA